MKKNKIISLILFSIYVIFSFSSLRLFYNLGSNEASSLLTRRPAIIDWSKLQANAQVSMKDIFQGKFTFHSHREIDKFEIVKDFQSKPSHYIATPTNLYPVYMQTRTGGLPLIVNKLMLKFFTPASSLYLFTWIFAFLSVFFYQNLCRQRIGFYFLLSHSSLRKLFIS